jgi:hypothetical protein
MLGIVRLKFADTTGLLNNPLRNGSLAGKMAPFEKEKNYKSIDRIGLEQIEKEAKRILKWHSPGRVAKGQTWVIFLFPGMAFI